MLRHSHRALYAAFDRFPSPKGAATHIARMAARLFECAGNGALLTLADADLPLYQCEGTVEVARLRPAESSLLERINAFQRFVYRHALAQADTLQIAHFRDPWSGIPILQALEDAGSACRTVYEINGLPSIEWPERYEGVARSTVALVRAEERRCWERADAIVVPSATIAANLERLGAPASRISVVHNGADLPDAVTISRPLDAPYLLYFGAVQPWQGLPDLVEALARLADFPELRLVICASVPAPDCAWIAALAERHGVAARIVWQHELDTDGLRPWLEHALVSAAPLTQCARNIEQGCCPLKILESMAHGVPVVASDLPAVREIIEPDLNGVLVAPDRPADLARALRLLLDYPERRVALGLAARRHIAAQWTWDHAMAALDAVYAGLSASIREEIHGKHQRHTGSVLRPARPLQAVQLLQ
jgi:glycosyltransferase involved in cell wall biosynthesis